jgi:hypothetical protein
MSPRDGMVIEMESSRCRMVAIEIDDPRGKSLLTGVVIETEDLRCRSLQASAAIELEDSRFQRVGIEMEDPRCRNLRNWWSRLQSVLQQSAAYFDELGAATTHNVIKPMTKPGGCNLDWRRSEMIILIIILVLVFGGGGGYYGYGRWGAGGGAGIGLGTVLLILLVCYLLGIFR